MMRTYIRKKLQAQEIQDVHALCRLCLGKTEKMIPIFDTNINDIFGGLSLRITMCLGLEVSREDEFPKVICQVCNSELDKFYAFKKSCAATYRTLKASIFTMKQNDNMKVDEFSQKQITNTFGSVQSDKSNYSVIIDPCKSLGKEFSQQTPINTQLREKIIQQENAILDVNRIQHIVPAERTVKKGEWSQTAPFPGQSVYTNSNPCTSRSTAEGFGNSAQMEEVNYILDAEKAQEEENKEQIDSIKTTQYLPAEIVSSLIEGGVLANREDGIEILDQGVRTFTLETPCGNDVVMELIEEEPYVSGERCVNSSRPKIFDSNLNSDARYCGTCGARFSTRGALDRHMRVHSGERPFTCACGRRFSQQEVLRRHQLVHQDKLPYQCPRCPKSYTQRGALQAHMRAHAPPGARPLVLHRCSRCPKLFIYPSGLSRHMNVHQGRDYPCDVCSRSFNDTSSLQRHRRAHHRKTR